MSGRVAAGSVRSRPHDSRNPVLIHQEEGTQMTRHAIRRRPLVVAVAVLATAALGTAEAAATVNTDQPTPGSATGGDSYYPQDGNGGYDAVDYSLQANYDPASHELAGKERITARATQSLSSFDLDLYGLTVDAVQVDGRLASFTRTGQQKLVITPSAPLWRGGEFVVDIAYHGVPLQLNYPGFGANGWQFGQDGGAFVAGEPESALTWYPVNDTPTDKATFHLAMTVPNQWGVIANGRELGSFPAPGGETTHVWSEQTPAAPYLTTVDIDKWTYTRTTLSDGTPVVSAFAPGVSAEEKANEARLPEILDFLASKFGPYPVDAAGGIFLSEPIDFSLETLSRPIYGNGAGDVSTIVHENTHQWYGDSVTIDAWKNTCLSECFASYAQWLWAGEKEGQDLDALYLDTVRQADSGFWNGKLYDMGAGDEFDAVYTKGPAMLYALRKYVGDTAFDQVLRTWPALHRNGNADMPEFQRYVEQVAHQNLQGFFDAWVYGTGKPAEGYLYPGNLRSAALTSGVRSN
jgi:aminopeptidase N